METTADSSATSRWNWKKSLSLFFLLITAFFVLYARIRMLSMPFERDEGEYAYIAQLMLRGIAPFKAAFTMKLPGTPLMYALSILLFGQTITGVHVGLLLVNMSAAILLFFLALRWLQSFIGASFTTAFFILLSLSPTTLGFAGHATHYVIAFALAGIFVLEKAFDKRKQLLFVLSGFLFCMAVMMKQPGVYFTFFAAALFLRQGFSKESTWKNLLGHGSFFALGYLLPVSILAATVLISGTFHTFWFWIVQYSFQYGSQLPFAMGWDNFVTIFYSILFVALPSWILMLLGCIPLGRTLRSGRSQKILLFFLFSFLALTPGLYFRQHYFIVLLPAAGLFAASALHMAHEFLRRSLQFSFGWIFIFATAIGWSLGSHKTFCFDTPQYDILRTAYGENPFPESVPIAKYIIAHTTASDYIGILGSEPQLYFYTRRLSASPHIYMYGLMEPQPYSHQMQMELIHDFTARRPKYIVFADIYASWLISGASDQTIIHWEGEFLPKYYTQVGVVEFKDNYDVEYRWDRQAIGYRTQEPAVYIFERRATALPDSLIQRPTIQHK